MWPKALLQLLELVPHVSRLLPMADKFLQSKATLDDATLKTIGDLRGELGQANASHAGLYRQMNEQSEALASISAETRATHAEVSALAERLDRIEKKIGKQMAYCAAASLVSGLTLLTIIVTLLLRH